MQAFIGHLAFVERKAEAVAGIEAADDFIKSFGELFGVRDVCRNAARLLAKIRR